jgi:hypothetical protein
MSIEKKLSELGLHLHAAPKPVAAYVPAVRTGNPVLVSGQLKAELGGDLSGLSGSCAWVSSCSPTTGYGDCGKPVCCNTHLQEMPPVSMKMAKLQKATLDPTKISGRCGHLTCCLR